MPDERQRELFDEFEKEKGKFKQLAEKISHKRKDRYVHAPLENVVFLGIVILMCAVVAFALGVERGKRLVEPVPEAENVSLPAEVAAPQIELNPIEITKSSSKGNYAIQLISYKKRERAEAERDALLDKKIDAFITESGKWFQVSAGSYATVKEAETAQKEFGIQYKGCFIKNKE